MRRPTRAIGARLLSLLLAGILAAPVAAAASPNAAGSASDTAANPTAPKSDFKKVERKLTRRGKVDASKVPAKPAKARPQKNLPRLSIPAPDTSAGPGAPLAPAPAAPGPPPLMAGLTARPPIVTPPFDGLAHGTSATQFEPPDPWVAVGPDHVVQVVNTAMAVFNRQGGLIRTVDLAEFFGVPIDPVTFNFDPRVIYDSLHGRWIATEVSFDCEDAGALGIGHGFLDIAVSNSADPLDQWTLYYLQFDGEFPDYPAAGTSTDKVAFGSNVFGLVEDGAGSCTPNGDDYRGTEIDVLDWAQLAAGGEAAVSVFRSNPDQFTARPALAVPATSPTIHGVVATYTATDIHAEYLAITGSVVPIDTVQITREDLTVSDRVGAFREPPIPTQPAEGTTTPNQIARAVDERPTDALWQNGRLVWVSTIGCTPAPDPAVRDCVRVTEIETVNRTRRQDFLVGVAGSDVYHGGIGLSMNGALHVTYTRSSLTENPSTHAVYQLPGDTPNAVSADELVKAGSAPYSIGERWGDYTGVAQDPQDPNVVWQTNEVSTGAWATHFSPLSTAAGTTFVPITPTRVLDTRPATNVGLTNRFAHRVARTWQVTGVGLIPPTAVAVTGNLAVVGQTGPGHVSVTPRATNTPFSATINFPLGDVRANNITTPLGPGGTLAAVYVAQPGKLTHLVFDVTGYFLAGDTGAEYNTVLPARIVDTRPTSGNRLTRNVPRTFQVTGNGGVPIGAVAVTGNLAVTQQTASGHISLTPTPDANPPTATLNFPVGDNRANGVTIPLSPGGQMSAVYKASVVGARTHLVFDVTGYYRDDPVGLSYFPLNPGRLMDTRVSIMTGLSGAFQANASRVLDTAGHLGIPPDAAAITGNLAVTQPNKAGHLAITPSVIPNPPTSTINFPALDTRANGVTQLLNGSGDLAIYFKAASGGTVHVILDITGYFR